jgi:hypothetical protein
VSSNKNLAAWLLARGGAVSRGRARPRSRPPSRDRGRIECGGGARSCGLFLTCAVVIPSDLDSAL